MNLFKQALLTIVSAALLSGSERRYEKHDLALGNLGPPSFNVTGSWTGTWDDTGRRSTESFAMDLRQTGPMVKGTVTFMDSARTKAAISGEARGSKIRLVMTPEPSLPETTWIGTVTGQTMTGTWYFHGAPTPGYASTGPWSATSQRPSYPKAEHPAATGWTVASAGTAKIAVPEGWRIVDGIQPAMLIYRQGDGEGVPAADETGAPLQIGLSVERFEPQQDSTDVIAKDIANRASANRDWKLNGPELTEAVVLSDESRATLITTGFFKGADRRSFYLKLVAKGRNHEVWVVTGYIVAGTNSALATRNSPLAVWLRAHVVSLTLNGSDINSKSIGLAYRVRERER